MSVGDTSGRLGRWLPVVLRVVAVTITLYPAVRKFIDYSARVSAFEAYGIPWPAVAVVLSGVVELLAVVSIALGIAGRLGAGVLAATMVVAVVAAGPNPANVLVLLASLGICLLGTGPYSAWTPRTDELGSVPERTG